MTTLIIGVAILALAGLAYGIVRLVRRMSTAQDAKTRQTVTSTPPAKIDYEFYQSKYPFPSPRPSETHPAHQSVETPPAPRSTNSSPGGFVGAHQATHTPRKD